MNRKGRREGELQGREEMERERGSRDGEGRKNGRERGIDHVEKGDRKKNSKRAVEGKKEEKKG